MNRAVPFAVARLPWRRRRARQGDVEVADSAAASPSRLMWWRFRQHRLAMASVFVLAFMYVVFIPFAEFIAPYDPLDTNSQAAYEPPTGVHLAQEEGLPVPVPVVYQMRFSRNPVTLAPVYTPDPSSTYRVGLFQQGESYTLWGFIHSDIHLFGVQGPQRLYLLGSDADGRDLFSELVFGARVSLTVGLVGVALSFILGIVIGGLAGYFGGLVDLLSQRAVELLIALPAIPLWMALSAAVPPHWGPIRTYFAITVILSLIGWASLARIVRSKFLSLREEDFVTAARLDGCGPWRTVWRHLLPSFTSQIIASLTLAVPIMILSETSLSFLGLGLQYPAISWGVLLQQAQNLRTVASAPWLLVPGVAVVVAILCFNFVGDGLRDAADPYSSR